MVQKKIIADINRKYKEKGEDPNTYLFGLLHSKPLNYWDYIQSDALLSLQTPRTDFPDEEIFIMYHQVTELTFKMMLHELKQIVEKQISDENILINKIHRLCRYVQMLINSFDIMKYGMDYYQFNIFRKALAPASGFQCVQFRIIEIYSTRLVNLVNLSDRNSNSIKTIEDCMKRLYWRKTTNQQERNGNITINMFEDKYLDELTRIAHLVKGKTLEDIVMRLPCRSEKLLNALTKFDRLYNVEWPSVHLKTAQHYLSEQGKDKASTGGTDWKKYLDPNVQKRMFFPLI